MTDLTPREREVVDLVAEGMTYAEIAVMLDGISEHTARQHARNAAKKTGISLPTRRALVRYVIAGYEDAA